MKSILNYIKKEVMLFISLLLALVSIVFVPLDNKYISYMDFHTLTILLSLMIVMAGLRGFGIFSMIGTWMLEKTRNVRSLTIVLVLLCFGFSMVITNDVALITFVPLTIEVIMMAGMENYLIRIIVLQTIASNLGSMLTPIGNIKRIPKINLWLHSVINGHELLVSVLASQVISNQFFGFCGLDIGTQLAGVKVISSLDLQVKQNMFKE